MLFSFFLVLTVLAAAHAQTCPSGCSCSSTITCNGLTVFPEFNFPKVTTFQLSNSNCSIPENAFAKMPRLRTITFSRSNMSRVGACAFSGLNLRDLTISYCNIGVIETGAFSRLTVTDRLKIQQSEIKKISSNAFNLNNINGGRYFELYNNQISEMKPYSFNNVKVNRFTISSCKITTLHKFAFNVTSPYSELRSSTIKNIGCRTLEDLSRRPHDLTLRCDCDLIPAIKAKRFNNPIKCLKDSELQGAIPGFGTDCSPPVVRAPSQCPRVLLRGVTASTLVH